MLSCPPCARVRQPTGPRLVRGTRPPGCLPCPWAVGSTEVLDPTGASSPSARLELDVEHPLDAELVSQGAEQRTPGSR